MFKHKQQESKIIINKVKEYCDNPEKYGDIARTEIGKNILYKLAKVLIPVEKMKKTKRNRTKQ